MRWLTILLLLSSLTFAYPTMFGPAGMPDSWDDLVLVESDTLRSAYHTSTDSLYWYNSNYFFYIRQVAASAGNRDMGIVFVEEDGTEHLFKWNDNTANYSFDGPVMFQDVKMGTVSGYARFASTTSIDILIDPDFTNAAVIYLGQSGDNDTTRVVGVQDFSSGGHLFPPQVTDAGPMTATNGTVGEMVFNLSDNKFYGCVTTGTPATWAAFH